VRNISNEESTRGSLVSEDKGCVTYVRTEPRPKGACDSILGRLAHKEVSTFLNTGVVDAHTGDDDIRF
jgi:hypothetical protein